MLSATELRSKIYQVLDQVIETGIPVKIKRNGVILSIVAEDPIDKLKNLKPHTDFIAGDPDELVHMDWSKEVDVDLS